MSKVKASINPDAFFLDFLVFLRVDRPMARRGHRHLEGMLVWMAVTQYKDNDARFELGIRTDGSCCLIPQESGITSDRRHACAKG